LTVSQEGKGPGEAIYNPEVTASKQKKGGKLIRIKSFTEEKKKRHTKVVKGKGTPASRERKGLREVMRKEMLKERAQDDKNALRGQI